ncbi:hypothetical protein ACVXZZ_02035 [Staphylococcus aureus]
MQIKNNWTLNNQFLEEAQYTELENDKPIDVSDFEEVRTCNRKRKRRRAILIETIATGSSGNCYVLNDGRTTLLFEAGIKFERVQKHFKYKTRHIAGVSYHTRTW